MAAILDRPDPPRRDLRSGPGVRSALPGDAPESDARRVSAVGAVAPPSVGARRRTPRNEPEHRALLRSLDDAVAWPGAATALLARFGFRLIQAVPGSGAESHLLVALRDRPTLAHFDPEALTYFATKGDRAAMATLDRRTVSRRGGTAARPVLWGHVHVIDRLPVENRFLTFGGELRVAVIDPGLAVLDLHSPAPIVRWGGHSQPTDALTEAIGAFFARLMVPIDFVPGAEARIDALGPDVLYLAFLIDWQARAARAERRGAEPEALTILAAAARRGLHVDERVRRSAEALLAELPGGPSG